MIPRLMSTIKRKAAARLADVLRRGSPVAVLRRRVAAAVHQRLVGPDPAAVCAGIWGASGERWFCPEDAVWDVHDDPAIYVGGLRSLMLQTLHPLAMAGVSGHSGYKGDPWGRLQRTGSYIAHTTYAPISTATAIIEREQDDYVRQTAIPARMVGVRDAPESVAELRATLHRFLPELMSSPQALDTIKFLVRQPPVPTPGKPVYWLLAAGAISILPRWVRQELKLPDSPFLDRWLWQPATSAVVRLMRWVMDDPSIAELKVCPAGIMEAGSTRVRNGLSDQTEARKMSAISARFGTRPLITTDSSTTSPGVDMIPNAAISG